MEVFGIFFAFIVVAIVIRLIAGSMDGDRVDEYVRQQGGELLHKQWAPFGKGWFGEKNDRIYEVRYRDQQSNIHEATVKTSMFSGVYFTQDKIVTLENSPAPSDNLAEENERLRQKIAELENRND